MVDTPKKEESATKTYYDFDPVRKGWINIGWPRELNAPGNLVFGPGMGSKRPMVSIITFVQTSYITGLIETNGVFWLDADGKWTQATPEWIRTHGGEVYEVTIKKI